MRTAHSLPYAVGRVSIQWSLCPGGLCPGGLCPGVSPSGVICPWDLCQGSPSHLGGLCLGGLCPEGSLSERPPQTETPPPLPVDRMTDSSKNINLPQTSFSGGKYTKCMQFFLNEWTLLSLNSIDQSEMLIGLIFWRCHCITLSLFENYRNESSLVMSHGVDFLQPSNPENHFTNGGWRRPIKWKSNDYPLHVLLQLVYTLVEFVSVSHSHSVEKTFLNTANWLINFSFHGSTIVLYSKCYIRLESIF